MVKGEMDGSKARVSVYLAYQWAHQGEEKAPSTRDFLHGGFIERSRLGAFLGFGVIVKTDKNEENIPLSPSGNGPELLSVTGPAALAAHIQGHLDRGEKPCQPKLSPLYQVHGLKPSEGQNTFDFSLYENQAWIRLQKG